MVVTVASTGPRGLHCRAPNSVSGSSRPLLPSRPATAPKHSWGRLLTCLRLMASRSRHTTSWPSQSDALKPFVQFRRMPWVGQDRQEDGGPLEYHLASPKACIPSEAYNFPTPQAGFYAHSTICLRDLPSTPSNSLGGFWCEETY